MHAYLSHTHTHTHILNSRFRCTHAHLTHTHAPEVDEAGRDGGVADPSAEGKSLHAYLSHARTLNRKKLQMHAYLTHTHAPEVDEAGRGGGMADPSAGPQIRTVPSSDADASMLGSFGFQCTQFTVRL